MCVMDVRCAGSPVLWRCAGPSSACPGRSSPSSGSLTENSHSCWRQRAPSEMAHTDTQTQTHKVSAASHPAASYCPLSVCSCCVCCAHLVLLTRLGSQEEAGDGDAAQVLWTGLKTNNQPIISISKSIILLYNCTEALW